MVVSILYFSISESVLHLRFFFCVAILLQSYASGSTIFASISDTFALGGTVAATANAGEFDISGCWTSCALLKTNLVAIWCYKCSLQNWNVQQNLHLILFYFFFSFWICLYFKVTCTLLLVVLGSIRWSLNLLCTYVWHICSNCSFVFPMHLC